MTRQDKIATIFGIGLNLLVFAVSIIAAANYIV